MGGHNRDDTGPSLGKLTQAAENRLKELSKQGTRILFACEIVDRKALDSHISASKVFKDKVSVFDAAAKDSALKNIDSSSVIIVFTDHADKADFLDEIVSAAAKAKKQGIHGKSMGTSLIPTMVSARRWSSLQWVELERMFAK